jgi:hypothetical protein
MYIHSSSGKPDDIDVILFFYIPVGIPVLLFLFIIGCYIVEFIRYLMVILTPLR